MRKVYRGRDIEVSFDLDICVHIGECLRGHRDVFNLRRRPWVLPDEADADLVAEIVERCPSGALLYRRLDGGPQEAPKGAKVTPIRNGPLLVTGEIEVSREDGTVETLPRATLCRCGSPSTSPSATTSTSRWTSGLPGCPSRSTSARCASGSMSRSRKRTIRGGSLRVEASADLSGSAHC
jgi:uncharacterized Fe-S cluster protein YjdI